MDFSILWKEVQKFLTMQTWGRQDSFSTSPIQLHPFSSVTPWLFLEESNLLSSHHFTPFALDFAVWNWIIAILDPTRPRDNHYPEFRILHVHVYLRVVLEYVHTNIIKSDVDSKSFISLCNLLFVLSTTALSFVYVTHLSNYSIPQPQFFPTARSPCLPFCPCFLLRTQCHHLEPDVPEVPPVLPWAPPLLHYSLV